MKKIILIGAAALAALAIGGCTDTKRAKLTEFGRPAHIVCYSGGQPIFDGYSTGRVSNPEGSDGYQFVDRQTRRLKEVSGECVIDYGAP